MRNPFMMSTPDGRGKTRPSVRAGLFLALSAVGGFASQAGKTAWEWVITK